MRFQTNCDFIYHLVFVTDVTHCPDVPLPSKINHSDKDHISADHLHLLPLILFSLSSCGIKMEQRKW